MKAIFLTVSLAFLSLSAQAQTVRFEGTVKSRQQCSDTGGVFSTVLGCKKLAVQNRRCTVDVTFGSDNFVKYVSVQVPEVTLRGESSKTSLSRRFDRPYLYTAGEMAYTGSFDGSSSVELGVKGDFSAKVTRVNLYVAQRIDKQTSTRYYTQYECRGLVRK